MHYLPEISFLQGGMSAIKKENIVNQSISCNLYEQLLRE